MKAVDEQAHATRMLLLTGASRDSERSAFEAFLDGVEVDLCFESCFAGSGSAATPSFEVVDYAANARVALSLQVEAGTLEAEAVAFAAAVAAGASAVAKIVY